jgi:hypothetical protein
MARGSPGHDEQGKPLQIAVDSAPGTTEATQHPGDAFYRLTLKQRGK